MPFQTLIKNRLENVIKILDKHGQISKINMQGNIKKFLSLALIFNHKERLEGSNYNLIQELLIYSAKNIAEGSNP